MLRCRLVSFCLASVSFIMLAACADYERNKVIEEHCGSCHSADRIYEKKRTKEEWRKLVHGMKIRGLKLTKEEEKKVYEELFENFQKK